MMKMPPNPKFFALMMTFSLWVSPIAGQEAGTLNKQTLPNDPSFQAATLSLTAQLKPEDTGDRELNSLLSNWNEFTTKALESVAVQIQHQGNRKAK